jgi:protein O-mannosyl-transferase
MRDGPQSPNNVILSAAKRPARSFAALRMTNIDRLRRELAIIVGLVLLTLVAYWQVGMLKFIYFDDKGYVYDNVHVQQGLTWENIGWACTTPEQANWHPLTWLSHLVDVRVFGLRSGWHHAVNLVFHILNTLLVFLVLRAMTGAAWPSGFVAALFAVHPLHVESVAWVAERKDLLSTFAGLLAIWAYVWYARRPGVWRYAAVAALMAMSLLAKPTLVTLPFFFLLLDFWPLGRLWPSRAQNVAETTAVILPRVAANSSRGKRRGKRAATKERRGADAAGQAAASSNSPPGVWPLLLEKAPLLLLSLVSSIVTCIMQWRGGSMATLTRLPVWARVGNALLAYVRYLGKTFWPVDLAVLYPPIPITWRPCLGAAALLLLITAVVLWFAWRGQRYLAVGWFWFLGLLVPVIGLVWVGEQSMADRYTYLPLVGIFVAITWGIAAATARWPRRAFVLAPAAAIVLATCTGLTMRQVSFWRNSETLFQHALEVTTGNVITLNNMGNILACPTLLPESDRPPMNLSLVERKQRAIDYYRRAVTIRPDYAEGYNNWGNVLSELGRRDEAIAKYRLALQYHDRYLEALTGLANRLVERAQENPSSPQAKPDVEEAIRHYRTALALRPDHAGARGNLGIALLLLGRRDEAIEEYHTALQYQPVFPEGHANLASALEASGDRDGAIAEYRLAAQQAPGWPVPREALQRLGAP